MREASPILTRVPPHNREAEQSALGAMLFDERILADGLEALEREDFYDEAHRRIYSTLSQMYEKGLPIDIVTVCDHLRQKGELESIGGGVYLVQPLDVLPTVAHHSYYFNIIIRERQKRELMLFGRELESEVSTSSEGLEELTEKFVFRLSVLASQRERAGLRPIEQAVTGMLREADNRHLIGSDILGYSTGIASLDRATLGAIKGKYIILGARPAMGKTALAIQLVETFASQGANCLMFELEMPAEEIAARQVARRSGVPVDQLMMGRDWSKNVLAAIQASQGLVNLPLQIDDRSRTIERVEAVIKRQHLRKPVDVVVIDYLQRLNSSQRFNSKHSEVSYYSHRLADLAGSLNICMIAVCQLSREVERRNPPMPQISDLKESGDIEQDADLIMFLYRPEVYLDQWYPEGGAAYEADKRKYLNLCKIYIAKARYFKTGVVNLNFFGETQKFTERDER